MPSEARAAGPSLALEGCGVWSSSLRGRESLKCQPWGTGREDPIQRPGSRQLLWEGVGLGSSSASESAEQEPGQGGDREGLDEDPGLTGGRETRKEALFVWLPTCVLWAGTWSPLPVMPALQMASLPPSSLPSSKNSAHPDLRTMLTRFLHIDAGSPGVSPRIPCVSLLTPVRGLSPTRATGHRLKANFMF